MKNQQRPDGEGAALHVHEMEDGRWTWRYVDPSSDLELHSNETFSSEEAARDWAQRAYPDVPFADRSNSSQSASNQSGSSENAPTQLL